MIVFLFFLAYNLLYLFSEYILRTFKKREWARKLAHIGTWIITLYSTNFLDIRQYIVLFIVFIIAFLLLRKFRLFELIHEEGRGYGDIYFIFWQFVALIFLEYDRNITLAILLILTLADGLAPFGAVISDKKLHGMKTYAGSLIFYAITLIILVTLYSWHPILLFIALLITFGELISKKWTDNIIVPLITLLCLLLIHEGIFPL